MRHAANVIVKNGQHLLQNVNDLLELESTGWERLQLTMSTARNPAAIQEVVRKTARELTGAAFVLRDEDRCFYADENAITPL